MTAVDPAPDRTADSFREFEKTFKVAKLRDELRLQNAADALQQDQIREMAGHTVVDSEWAGLVDRAQ